MPHEGQKFDTKRKKCLTKAGKFELKPEKFGSKAEKFDPKGKKPEFIAQNTVGRHKRLGFRPEIISRRAISHVL